MRNSRQSLYIFLKTITVVSFSLLLLTNCASTKITVDYNHAIDFSQYKTFDWAVQDLNDSGDPQIDHKALNEIIRSEISADLIKKGFTQALVDQADLLIKYALLVKENKSFQTDPAKQSLGVVTSSGASTFNIQSSPGFIEREHKMGTLIIEIIDAKNQASIWQGIGGKSIKSSSTRQETITITHKVGSKLLGNFPPSN